MIHETADNTVQYKRDIQTKASIVAGSFSSWLYTFSCCSLSWPGIEKLDSQAAFQRSLLVQHIKTIAIWCNTIHTVSGAWVRRTPAKASAWAPAWWSLAASSTPYPSHPTSAPSFANLTTTVSSGEHVGMEHSAIYSAATISMWVLLTE